MSDAVEKLLEENQALKAKGEALERDYEKYRAGAGKASEEQMYYSDGLRRRVAELEAEKMDLMRQLVASDDKVKTAEDRIEVLTQELEEIGYDDAHEESPEVDPPICRVCLHTIRHEPICNDCAKKMCLRCGSTDHLACISVKDNPSTTWTLEPMKCAGCGSTPGLLSLRDGRFFCEKC